MVRCNERISMVKKKWFLPIVFAEKHSQMDILSYISKMETSNKRILTRELSITSLMQRLPKRHCLKVFRSSSSRTSKLKNITQTARKKLSSLMALSRQFSHLEKKKAYSRMEHCKEYRQMDLRQLDMQVDKPIASCLMVRR